MTAPLRLGLVGLGKIALDQHVPTIGKSPNFRLIAAATLSGEVDGIPIYRSLGDMLETHPELDGIVMCQPPSVRFEASRDALLAGKHVFLEKPPGTDPAEVHALHQIAVEQGVTLFTAWHSRWSKEVAALRTWCSAHRLQRVHIEWKEDVRVWHPGQEWIWHEGGFGVFDPGMNALSILTHVLPEPLSLTLAELEFPANRSTPIAAHLALKSASESAVEAHFDWRQTGEQIWRIEFEADDDRFLFGELEGTANRPGALVLAEEYGRMYDHFHNLVQLRQCDVDVTPLEIVMAAYAQGRISPVEPFDW